MLIKSFPQNLFIKKPYLGALIFFLVLFVFVIIYRPLGVSPSGTLGFSFTMLAYCAIITLFELGLVVTISRTNCFRPKDNWTIANEVLSIFMILTGIGISAYLAGFIMEPTDSRWTFSTFFDSFTRSVLVAVFPVILPSLLNIRYAFATETFQYIDLTNQTTTNQHVLINIESKAKKENLSFYTNEFIYAESNGNYVIFYLIQEENTVKVSIRNSISEIESQLDRIPYFMRTHRAFIVNLKKITSHKGNALGYRLTIECDGEIIIPVSRQNARKFKQMMS